MPPKDAPTPTVIQSARAPPRNGVTRYPAPSPVFCSSEGSSRSLFELGLPVAHPIAGAAITPRANPPRRSVGTSNLSCDGATDGSRELLFRSTSLAVLVPTLGSAEASWTLANTRHAQAIADRDLHGQQDDGHMVGAEFAMVHPMSPRASIPVGTLRATSALSPGCRLAGCEKWWS